MRITKRQLRRIIREQMTHDQRDSDRWDEPGGGTGWPDYSELIGHSADDMSQEVAEIVAAQYPNYHELDEESLDQLVNNEIGNLRPGPLDDDWPDVIDAAMTILMSSG